MRKQEFNSKHLPSPARRGSRSRTASPPASLAIRKAPSASVESIEPRPPRPCEVGRPKGGEGKTDANLTIFFSTCCAVAPQLAATPWGGSPPRPLCQKICYSDCRENCPLRPLRAPRRFRNPKIGQQLGAQPTPRFRVMSEAMSDVEIEALIDPLPPFTFCRPFSFDSKLIW